MVGNSSFAPSLPQSTRLSDFQVRSSHFFFFHSNLDSSSSFHPPLSYRLALRLDRPDQLLSSTPLIHRTDRLVSSRTHDTSSLLASPSGLCLCRARVRSAKRSPNHGRWVITPARCPSPCSWNKPEASEVESIGRQTAGRHPCPPSTYQRSRRPISSVTKSVTRGCISASRPGSARKDHLGLSRS